LKAKNNGAIVAFLTMCFFEQATVSCKYSLQNLKIDRRFQKRQSYFAMAEMQNK